MPKGYIWEIRFAERKSKKGRAMGEMVMEEGKIERGKERTGKKRKSE